MKSRYHKFVAKKEKEKIVGEVRQSQLLTSFGCGAIVDFVDDTVMIAGTDHWDWANQTPENEFILYSESLQSLLDVDYFVKPKMDVRQKAIYEEKTRDIPAYRFPEMLYCVKCSRLMKYQSLSRSQSGRLKCFCSRGNQNTLVASRFAVICENGHIEDFPYELWVHKGECCQQSKAPKLSMFHVGKRSGMDSLFVKCESCEAIRGMQGAFSEGALEKIKSCGGGAPWLHSGSTGPCGNRLKTVLRTETNVYFPAVVSALSIPPYGTKIMKELEGFYSVLSQGDTVAEPVIRNVILPKFPLSTYEEITSCFHRLQKLKSSHNRKQAYDIYCDEYRVLTSDTNETDEYSAHAMEVPEGMEGVIRKVMAVDKLTENIALIGFTRGQAWSGRIEDPRLASLSSKKQNWYPAVQMKGEGIFIEFQMEALRKWKEEKKEHYKTLFENLGQSPFVTERANEEYVLLHTFAHLLIRQLSVVCGYNMASLKEKIYVTQPDQQDEIEMAGVLIYTASSDADGSLGGLVEQADPEKLGLLVRRLIADAGWCASDPLCADSYGGKAQGVYSLNYAACYSCTLLPETSCEYHNVLLDRRAVTDLFELLGI